MKRLRLISNIISILLIGGYVVFLTACWTNIPETVPTHFDVLGRADAYGSKESLIAEVAIMAALFLLLAVAERFPSVWNFPVKVTAENKARLFMKGFAMIGAMKVLMVCMFINGPEQHCRELSGMATVSATGTYHCGYHCWDHSKCACTLRGET